MSPSSSTQRLPLPLFFAGFLFFLLHWRIHSWSSTWEMVCARDMCKGSGTCGSIFPVTRLAHLPHFLVFEETLQPLWAIALLWRLIRSEIYFGVYLFSTWSWALKSFIQPGNSSISGPGDCLYFINDSFLHVPSLLCFSCWHVWTEPLTTPSSFYSIFWRVQGSCLPA